TATPIATGGMIPSGTDAVVMIEQAEISRNHGRVFQPATPGAGLSFAGSDMVRGQIVVPQGTRLTARETGTLAAIGITTLQVYRRPRVAVFSTGNEIVAPGEDLPTGYIYDSNLRILCDILREIGCEPVDLGVVPDQLPDLRTRLNEGLQYDAVILSGGTSKGEGDHCVTAVREVAKVIAHGVAVKPGKPLCLAAAGKKPVVVLPGFPTSAVFTFHEFVVPVLLALAGGGLETAATVRARSPLRIHKELGRTEFVLVSLLRTAQGLVAYPLGKGSGSVTTFAHADGFITLERQQEFIEADELVEVRLLGRDVRPADIVFIGSHCVGLDYLLSLMRRAGFTTKSIIVGSRGGILAAHRGECDFAGVHLCDEQGIYNHPFLPDGVTLVPGYGRMQGIVYRDEEPHLSTARMVNRNRGSGTRVLIDEILQRAQPPGFSFEVCSHHAVAAAIAQHRADWGVAIEPVVRHYGLKFRPLREEHYDFFMSEARGRGPAVQAFLDLLASREARDGLAALGFRPGSDGEASQS
ncbi:MAG: molybdopterin biosynthesis protein, partial [Planctomycetota bacterium]